MKDRLIRRMFMVVNVVDRCNRNRWSDDRLLGRTAQQVPQVPQAQPGRLQTRHKGRDMRAFADASAAGLAPILTAIHPHVTAPTQAAVTGFAVAASGALNSTGTFTISFTAAGPNGEDLALNTLSGGQRLPTWGSSGCVAKLSAGAGAGDATKWVNFNYGVNDRNPAFLTKSGNNLYVCGYVAHGDRGYA